MKNLNTLLHNLLCFLLIMASQYNLSAQSLCDYADTSFTVLHFTKTNGWDHNTRNQSADMFEEIGEDNNFTITNTQDASIFDDLNALNAYSVIVFSNTSGSNLLSQSQKDNFEAYIAQGGSFIGIHAASDTYRTGWPYYNKLLGAIVQTSPNHTSSNHTNFMDHYSKHEVLDGLPDPWEKTEEYYYWDLNGGMIQEDSIGTLLKVRRTGNNEYDRERPITWLKTFPSGARSFYTALGHAQSNFTGDNNFRQLLTNAVCWAAYDKDFFEIGGNNVKMQNTHLVISESGNSIIMKSPNGSCHRMVIDNTGHLKMIPVKCVD
ncbi:MAG: ThuA domain-containing protein [Bacteroidota bacterium]